jgi:hypothetical protein
MVYKPSEDRMSLIDTETGAVIEPTPGLYFADNDPMLSLRNGGVTSGITKYFLFAAKRVTEETPIQGVQWVGKKFNDTWDPHSDHRISSGPVVIPKGSLLLRSFAENSGYRIEWYALTPSQVNPFAQNLGRNQYQNKPFVVDQSPDSIMAGCLNNSHEVTVKSFKKFTDPLQIKAHLEDAQTCLDLGLIRATETNYSYL